MDDACYSGREEGEHGGTVIWVNRADCGLGGRCLYWVMQEEVDENVMRKAVEDEDFSSHNKNCRVHITILVDTSFEDNWLANCIVCISQKKKSNCSEAGACSQTIYTSMCHTFALGDSHELITMRMAELIACRSFWCWRRQKKHQPRVHSNAEDRRL